ncbi:response regulator [Pseudomonas sp. CCM 7893]|uniref:histidine kinase n=1 Tax=Pseudomonas spelaei TaxID=1055469 RepID=A0A6I3W0A9_9PSED|nr:ATP-binding protein [Pseudomonas spelaei]MUF03627.1 response regulator [Pseudomonas spelaei]
MNGNCAVSMVYRGVLLVLLLLCFLLGGSPLLNADERPELSLTQEERDWIANHPVLRVAVFSNLVPFEYMNGSRLHGLSSRYLTLIASRTGLSFIFIANPENRAHLDLLAKGEADLVSSARNTHNQADASGLSFTASYYTTSAIIITRVGKGGIVDLGQLAGKTAVVPGLDRYLPILSNVAPGVKLISERNPVKMLTMVRDGMVDAAVASDGLLIPYLYRRFQGELQISGGVPALYAEIGMAVRADQLILLSVLQKTLRSISADENKAIYDSWFADMDLDGPSMEQIADYFDRELLLLLVVIVLLLAVAWQNRQQRRRAIRNEREKAMFLAVMSHEIRSPMNAVLAAVELLGHTPLDEQQRHFTDLAQNGANALLRLLDDVLDISKLEAGQLKLNLEPVDVLALVQNVVDLNQLRATEKALALNITGERAIPALLLDDTRLAQVLHNLVSNAIKFTESGGVEVDLQLLKDQAGDPQQLVICIIDSGIGLSENAQTSLFQSNVHTEHVDKRKGDTGLGLAICKELVKLMHGELTLKSKLGVGTTVQVSLRVSMAPDLDAPVVVEAVPPMAEIPLVDTSPRLLVVEDTLANLEVLRAQIQGFGCEVLLAADGAQGLALFTANRVNLVLMDCNLPDQDGYSLASEFRDLELTHHWPHCPIIAISALTGDEHLERCFDAGMDGALSKPIRLSQLQEIIELWCNVAVVQQVQPLIPQVLDLSAVHEEVHRDLDSLLKAVALCEGDAALRAAHRLHGATLVLKWTTMVQSAETLERLLRDQVDWSDEAYVRVLGGLVDQWYDLTDAPAQEMLPR